MPIRFACPKCQQRLSISTRKAGSSYGCPRCGQNALVPTTAEPHETPAASDVHHSLALSSDDARLDGSHEAVTETVKAVKREAAPSDLSTNAIETLQQSGWIIIRRSTLYLQASLIALVAAASFAAGFVVGGAQRLESLSEAGEAAQ